MIVTLDRLRESGMLQGKRAWLDRPSTLFDLLVKADARDGTVAGPRATTSSAMRLAHAAAAVDLVPSPDEIAAIDRYRGVLLAAFDAAGVARPGVAPARRRRRRDRPTAPATATGGAGRRPTCRRRARSRSCSPSSTTSSASRP